MEEANHPINFQPTWEKVSDPEIEIDNVLANNVIEEHYPLIGINICCLRMTNRHSSVVLHETSRAFCVKQVIQYQTIINFWHSLSCTLEQLARKPCTLSFSLSYQVHLTTTPHQLLLAAEHDRPWNFHQLSPLSNIPIDLDQLSSSQADWPQPVDRPDNNCWVLASGRLFVQLTACIQPISASLPIAKVLRVSVICVIQIDHFWRIETVCDSSQHLTKLISGRPHFKIAVAEVVEYGSSKNGSDPVKTGRYPSSINQIGGYLFVSLASAGNKSDVMNSICVDHPDVLVAQCIAIGGNNRDAVLR